MSVNSFAHHQVRLLLNALAYNLVHATRALLEDSTGEGWSLLRVRQRVLNVPLLAVRARYPGRLEVCPPHPPLHRSHDDQR